MQKMITLKDVYIELKTIENKMATKEELESFIETLEIMSDPDLMKQIEASEEDIKAGRVKEIHSVKDLL